MIKKYHYYLLTLAKSGTLNTFKSLDRMAKGVFQNRCCPKFKPGMRRRQQHRREPLAHKRETDIMENTYMAVESLLKDQATQKRVSFCLAHNTQSKGEKKQILLHHLRTL